MQFFLPDELKCHCGNADCDAVPMDPLFMSRLIALRQVFGQPMLVTSATRCKKHNRVVGGREDSMHPHGKAVDVSCPDGIYMMKLVVLALKMGFRVGVKNRMVHLDLAPGPQLMFGY